MDKRKIKPTLFCRVAFNENVGVFQDVVAVYHKRRFIKVEEMHVDCLYMGVTGCDADHPDACLYGIDGFYAIRPDGKLVSFYNEIYNPKLDAEMERLHKSGMKWYEILELMNL